MVAIKYVPLSMVKLFVEVLNNMFLFQQKIHYHGPTKNNYAANLRHLPVSASNSMQLLSLFIKLFSLLP